MAKSARPAIGEPAPRSFALHFHAPEEIAHVADELGRDVSALAVIGDTLFCACDETATVERLVFDRRKKAFTGHTNFPLSNVFDLPDGAGGEMDIEGLAVDSGYLWITGSHSLKRDDPSDIEPAVDDLGDIDWDANRGFLGRLPLADRGNGVHEPVADIAPLRGGEPLRAAMMKMGKKGRKSIRKLLGDDELLAPFMGTPCKENGFDVEGLAVRGDRVVLGLRGPVLGSFAILVDLRLKLTKQGWLKASKVDGARYRLHALDLEGLGIRDILFVGERLYLLAGPTQDIEGLQKIFALDEVPHKSSVIRRNAIETVRTLELRDGEDHAEGLALFAPQGQELMLIAHDSPGDDRYDRDRNRLLLDAFELS